ncbi:MAG TPA: LysM peptidoglycan-binding domain-containing protein [Nocardioides sp.]|nr:LysM peptidoglycan-binding domain-containing protein [Nocardioides sp.]
MSIYSRSLLRPAAVWVAVTGALAAVLRQVLPVVAGRWGSPDFADLLVTGCAAVAAVASLRLWLVTTTVVADLLRRRPADAHGTGLLRAAVLAACGVAVLATAAPAGATPRPVSPLDGLPLPDRAVGAATTRSGTADPIARGPATVRVRPGDTLWSIAVTALGPRATEADVATYWPRIGTRNAALIGDDPDLILPGQRLELPPTHEEDTWNR